MRNQFYYEFKEQDYYALIAVNVEKYDLKTKPHKKATELYVGVVAGESVEEVLEEGDPIQVTKEYAFMKFIYAHEYESQTVKELIKQFEESENEVLLIDSALI